MTADGSNSQAPGGGQSEAWERFAERLAEALTGLAADLRDGAGAPRPAPTRRRSTTPPPAAIPSTPAGLSERQVRAWERPELDAEHGVSSGQLSRLLGWKQPNADQVLRRLEELGHLSRITGEGVRPARWRRQPV